MGNSILQASSSGIVQFIQLLMIYHKAGNFHGCKFSWIFQKPVLPKFSQILILQQGSRPMTTPQLQQRQPCEPIREQNLNPSAIWLDGTVLTLATGWCKNLEVMTLPCTKASLCVTQHAFVHGCTLHVWVTVLCVFKFHCLLCYFKQEVIVADVLICFMHAESKTDTQTLV